MDEPLTNLSESNLLTVLIFPANKKSKQNILFSLFFGLNLDKWQQVIEKNFFIQFFFILCDLPKAMFFTRIHFYA